MTQRFILDENVVILAQKGENDHEERDTTCVELLQKIISICHTIVLDPNLYTQYQHQLTQLGPASPQLGVQVLRVLKNAFRTQGKIDLLSADAPEFPEEHTIPPGGQDDIPIVRLAVATRVPLVTTDSKLANHLKECGVLDAYNLQVLSPNEALESL